MRTRVTLPRSPTPEMRSVLPAMMGCPAPAAAAICSITGWRNETTYRLRSRTGSVERGVLLPSISTTVPWNATDSTCVVWKNTDHSLPSSSRDSGSCVNLTSSTSSSRLEVVRNAEALITSRIFLRGRIGCSCRTRMALPSTRCGSSSPSLP